MSDITVVVTGESTYTSKAAQGVTNTIAPGAKLFIGKITVMACSTVASLAKLWGQFVRQARTCLAVFSAVVAAGTIVGFKLVLATGITGGLSAAIATFWAVGI